MQANRREAFRVASMSLISKQYIHDIFLNFVCGSVKEREHDYVVMA